MFELTIDEENTVMIPSRVLSTLSLKAGDKVNLYTDEGKIIIEKKQGLSEEEYEHLLDDAASYAKAMGIDERDCYQIVEEYMASLK